MPIALQPLHALFGAEVSGVDLAAPLDEAVFARVREAFEEHSVLVFHDQPLTDEQQIAFSLRFGPLERTIRSIASKGTVRPEVADLSNVDAEDALIPPDDKRMIYHSGNMLWHSDSSFKRVPAMASLLSGREVPPEGGQTEFASLRVAWVALPPSMQQRLEGLVAVHSFVYSRGLVAPDLMPPEHAAQVPPVRQALVRANPVNGRRSLFLGSHASRIDGMGVEEGRALLASLLELATRPERVYRHPWRRGDLVMWDNRCMLHRGRPWDGTRYRRVMHRTTVAGEGPTVPEPDVVAEPAAARA